jgi:UDPglucose--hexose-1-phosphate uridylyltransferase
MTERRYDPLADRWVIVSPDRVERPWQGESANPPSADSPDWLGDCYLCPRTTRSSGATNPDYRQVYVFDNDFPALDAAQSEVESSELLRAEPVTGRCRVLCYDHRHNRTLATLGVDGIVPVVNAWVAEHAELSRDHAWVQIFENNGRMMGCSSEHPHGQIWASSHMPTIARVEDDAQRKYADAHGSPLLLDYVHHEKKMKDRIVTATDHWTAVVPWWAAWPFETLVIPNGRTSDLSELSDIARRDLAELLASLLRGYDRLFDAAMPYSMGWHGRGKSQGKHWQLHAHFYPPLLRSATVRKHMVGYELLAEIQRDLTPEAAAERLRQCVSPAG